MEKIKQWHLTVGAEMASRRMPVFLAVLRLITVVYYVWPRSGKANHIICFTFPGSNNHADVEHMFTEAKATITPLFRFLCLLDTRLAVTFYAIWKYVPITASATLFVRRFGFNL